MANNITPERLNQYREAARKIARELLESGKTGEKVPGSPTGRIRVWAKGYGFWFYQADDGRVLEWTDPR